MWGVALVVLAAGVMAKAVCGGLDGYLLSTGMLPPWAVPGVGRGVLTAEALAAVLLVWPRLRRWGWVAVGALGAAFATVHVAAAILGDVEPCRCFGVELSHNALWSHVGMAVLCAGLVTMAVFGVRPRTQAALGVQQLELQGVARCESRERRGFW